MALSEKLDINRRSFKEEGFASIQGQKLGMPMTPVVASVHRPYFKTIFSFFCSGETTIKVSKSGHHSTTHKPKILLVCLLYYEHTFGVKFFFMIQVAIEFLRSLFGLWRAWTNRARQLQSFWQKGLGWLCFVSKGHSNFYDGSQKMFLVCHQTSF